MSRDLISHGMAVFNAVSALKLKRATFVSVPEGVEIHQLGKPALLLTHAAAEAFDKEMQEDRL